MESAPLQADIWGGIYLNTVVGDTQWAKFDEVSKSIFVQFDDGIAIQVETPETPESSQCVRIQIFQLVIPQHQLL